MRPDPPTNATIKNMRDKYEQGESVQYACKEGYKSISGNLNRTCQASGSFSGRPPKCMRKQ